MALKFVKKKNKKNSQLAKNAIVILFRRKFCLC